MKKINNRSAIISTIKLLNLDKEFSTEKYQFEIREYEKKEQIVSPLNPMNYFMFLLSGRLRIYQLNEDSTFHTILNVRDRGCLGQYEFCFGSNHYTLYAESLSPVRCLVLPFRQPENNLKDDNQFLMFLLKNTLLNQVYSYEIAHCNSSLEDKLIFYMKNVCDNQTLTSINDTVDALHCSRSQLQRILKKLCEKDILEHFQKGCYSIK